MQKCNKAHFDLSVAKVSAVLGGAEDMRLFLGFYAQHKEDAEKSDNIFSPLGCQV